MHKKVYISTLLLFIVLSGCCFLPAVLLFELEYKPEYDSYNAINKINVTVYNITGNCGECDCNCKPDGGSCDTCPCCGVNVHVNYTVNDENCSSFLTTRKYVNLPAKSIAVQWGVEKYEIGSNISCYSNSNNVTDISWDKNDSDYLSPLVFSILMFITFFLGGVAIMVCCIFALVGDFNDWNFRRRNRLTEGRISNELARVPNISFVSVGNGESCSICTNRKKSHLLRSCKHEFCFTCIHEWLSQNNNNTCPLCRRPATLLQIMPL